MTRTRIYSTKGGTKQQIGWNENGKFTPCQTFEEAALEIILSLPKEERYKANALRRQMTETRRRHRFLITDEDGDIYEEI